MSSRISQHNCARKQSVKIGTLDTSRKTQGRMGTRSAARQKETRVISGSRSIFLKLHSLLLLDGHPPLQMLATEGNSFYLDGRVTKMFPAHKTRASLGSCKRSPRNRTSL